MSDYFEGQISDVFFVPFVLTPEESMGIPGRVKKYFMGIKEENYEIRKKLIDLNNLLELRNLQISALTRQIDSLTTEQDVLQGQLAGYQNSLNELNKALEWIQVANQPK